MTKLLANTPQTIAPIAMGVSQRCGRTGRGGERLDFTGAPATLNNSKLASTVSINTTFSSPRPGISAIDPKLPSSLSLTAFSARVTSEGCEVDALLTVEDVMFPRLDGAALAAPAIVREGSHQVRV
jgi:hypothetical protein